jgi:hypothetical protein
MPQPGAGVPISLQIITPALLLQYRAARDAVTGLQSENKTLQLQLQSLRHHLVVHRSRVRSEYDTKRDTKEKLETAQNQLRDVRGRRDHLVLIHSSSVRGTRTKDYMAVYMEYVRLQDQFRGIVVDHMLVRYQLQTLIIDTVRTRGWARPQSVRFRLMVILPPLTPFL